MKEKEIVELLGKNHTTPIEFKEKTHSEIYGLYTYRSKVYCFRAGMDIPFESISEKEQEECLSLIKAKKYVKNDSLQ